MMTGIENQYLTLQNLVDCLKLKLRTVRDLEGRGIIPASSLRRWVRVSDEHYHGYVHRLLDLGTGGTVEEIVRLDPRDPIIKTIREYLESLGGRALIRKAF
jgi:hypothetical protein